VESFFANEFDTGFFFHFWGKAGAQRAERMRQRRRSRPTATAWVVGGLAWWDVLPLPRQNITLTKTPA